MDPKTVAKPKGKFEVAIAEIIVKMGLKKMLLLASTPDHEPVGEGGGSGLRSGSGNVVGRPRP